MAWRLSLRDTSQGKRFYCRLKYPPRTGRPARWKWFNTGTDTEEVAQEVRRALQQEIDSGRDPFCRERSYRLAEVFEQYVNAHRHSWADATFEGSVWVRDILLAALGDVSVAEFDRASVDVCREYLVKRGAVNRRRRDPISPHTVNSFLKRLRAFLHWVVEEELVPEWKMPKVSLMKVSGRKVRNHFQPEELSKLLEVASQRMFCGIPYDYVLSFAVLSGLRKSEMLRLRWTEIDLNQNVLYVIGQTKTGDERIVPVTKELRQVIRKIRAIGIDDGRVFPFSRVSGRFNKLFRIVLAEAGIEGLKYHNLRATSSFNLHSAGVSDHAAAEMHGHTPSTMRKYYLTWDIAELKEKAAQISNTGITKAVTRSLRRNRGIGNAK